MPTTEPGHRTRANRPAQRPRRGELRQKILDDFQALRIPLRPEQLDAVLARAESEGMSHLEFLRALISEQADQRRERGIAHRIREAGFAESKTLADFDWQFNAAAIDRVQIEALAAGGVHRPQGEPGPGRAERRGQESHDPGHRPASLCAGLSRAVHDQRRGAGAT